MLSCWPRVPELTDSESGHLCCFSKVRVKCHQDNMLQWPEESLQGCLGGGEHREVVKETFGFFCG